MGITPGAYLQKRRRAAGMSLEDVAIMLDTSPAISNRARVDMLEEIEADLTPIDPGTVKALRFAFPFDPTVLNRLIDLHVHRANLPAPQLCRECGCSFFDPCVDHDRRACAWADRDLCTHCVPPAPAADAIAANDDRRSEAVA